MIAVRVGWQLAKSETATLLSEIISIVKSRGGLSLQEALRPNMTHETFDISGDVKLLQEIRDIRDELGILRTLFQQQSSVLFDFFRHTDRAKAAKMKHAVDKTIEAVERLDTDAERSHKAVRLILLIINT